MFSYISHYVLFFISPSGATGRSSIEVSLIDVEYRNSTYKLKRKISLKHQSIRMLSFALTALLDIRVKAPEGRQVYRKTGTPQPQSPRGAPGG